MHKGFMCLHCEKEAQVGYFDLGTCCVLWEEIPSGRGISFAQVHFTELCGGIFVEGGRFETQKFLEMEGCQEEEEKGVQTKQKIYPHLVRPCIGYGLSDDDGDVVDADECEREGVKCITLLELGIDIREEEESAFDPAELGSELCPEAPLFKAEQLGESGGGGAIIRKELGIETPGSNTGEILAEKQLEEEGGARDSGCCCCQGDC
jgi:hypothetical protein